MALINADKVKVKGKKKAQKNKIKVAIMDSGVEYNTTKQSVIRVNMLENEIAPYFEDGTGHGTSIADVVSEINPCAEIYSVNNALHNQATLDNIFINTKYFKDGKYALPCRNCQVTFEGCFFPKQ